VPVEGGGSDGKGGAPAIKQVAFLKAFLKAFVYIVVTLFLGCIMVGGGKWLEASSLVEDGLQKSAWKMDCKRVAPGLGIYHNGRLICQLCKNFYIMLNLFYIKELAHTQLAVQVLLNPAITHVVQSQ